MRLALLLLACTAALAASADADVTIDGLPVAVCVNDICTPCVDPVTIPAPVLDFEYTGAEC